MTNSHEVIWKKMKNIGSISDWAALELSGTTFSGHSFRTTIGNSCDSFIFLLMAKKLGTGNGNYVDP